MCRWSAVLEDLIAGNSMNIHRSGFGTEVAMLSKTERCPGFAIVCGGRLMEVD
jgi:hypothetical protein